MVFFTLEITMGLFDTTATYEERQPHMDGYSFSGETIPEIVAKVNYAPPKGGELVMLPMLPWQAYSTIGWLTCTLPYRLVLSNE